MKSKVELQEMSSLSLKKIRSQSIRKDIQIELETSKPGGNQELNKKKAEV
jgi:hypothetical protein